MTRQQSLRCIDPGAVSRDDLLAFARGEAGSDVREHLSRCAFCSLQAARYARTDTALRRRLYRTACPPSETLGEYVLGMLGPAETRAVAEHLLECPHCAEERQRIATFIAQPDEPLQPAGIGQALRRLFARPVVNRSPALALRGGQNATTSYTVDGFALTLGTQVASHAGNKALVGLLLGEGTSTEGASVRLFGGDDLLRATAIDDLGNFVIDDVPNGEYRLEFGLPGAVIVVDPLPVA